MCASQVWFIVNRSIDWEEEVSYDAVRADVRWGRRLRPCVRLDQYSDGSLHVLRAHHRDSATQLEIRSWWFPILY